MDTPGRRKKVKVHHLYFLQNLTSSVIGFNAKFFYHLGQILFGENLTSSIIAVNAVDEDLKPYYQFRHDLHVVAGVVCYKDRVIFPAALRDQVLDAIHARHC
jgi:hypothetical protein